MRRVSMASLEVRVTTTSAVRRKMVMAAEIIRKIIQSDLLDLDIYDLADDQHPDDHQDHRDLHHMYAEWRLKKYLPVTGVNNIHADVENDRKRAEDPAGEATLCRAYPR